MSSLLSDVSRFAQPAMIGGAAPDFSLQNDQGEDWRLSENLGGVIVLLFYPQDETLVCTRQLCSVRDNWENYLETKATIVGISPGSPVEHQKFSRRLRLPIPLLADPNREITKIYSHHWLFPVSFTRSVVVIDAEGIIRNRNTMLRVFRPSDAHLITDIYAARGDAMNAAYKDLSRKINSAAKT